MRMGDFWKIVICSSFALARIMRRWIIKACPCLSLWVSLWMGTTWAFLTTLDSKATWGKQIWLSQLVLRGSHSTEEARYASRKMWPYWNGISWLALLSLFKAISNYNVLTTLCNEGNNKHFCLAPGLNQAILLWVIQIYRRTSSHAREHY